MSSRNLALRDTHFSSIKDSINDAPSCAESCLGAYWERIIDVCDSDRDWPCLCARGPPGEWTAAQQQDWVTVADSCIAAGCDSRDISDVQKTRVELSDFCNSVLNPPSTISSNSTTTTSTRTSSTTSTSLSNSTTSTSSSSSRTRITATPTKVKNPFNPEPTNSNSAPSFSPSKSWLIMGTLWLSLSVIAQF